MERREFGRRVAMALPLLSVTARGSEFWNDKAPADWNDKEVKKLLSKSPWAKEAVAEFDPNRMGGMGGPGMGRRGGMGGEGGGLPGGGGMPGGGDMPGGGGMPGGGMGGPRGGGGMGPGGGGMGGPDGGGFEPPKFSVRWESEPVREGEIKAEAKYAEMLAEAAKDHYIIAASGGGMWGRRGEGGPGGGLRGPGPGGTMDPQQREQFRQQMEARIMQATTLTAKGKEPVQCVKVVRAQSNEGFITFFLFPRSAAFSLDDKEVTFQTAMGPMELRTKFALKDMVYKGKLAL